MFDGDAKWKMNGFILTHTTLTLTITITLTLTLTSSLSPLHKFHFFFGLHEQMEAYKECGVTV